MKSKAKPVVNASESANKRDAHSSISYEAAAVTTNQREDDEYEDPEGGHHQPSRIVFG